MNGRGLERAMQWVRRHERSLARAVLALFCVAWLQAAVVPCAMAAPAMQDCEHHCPYCPPEHAAAADHAGSCAYPHQPQADGRAAPALAGALPAVLPVAPVPAVVALDMPAAAVAAGPPRIPIPVQYCRYLE
jgi:hypothetical protein